MMKVLIERLKKSVEEGDKENAIEMVQQAMERDLSAEKILHEGLISAMEVVGKRFEEGEYYVPEMLVAARAMQAALSLLRPSLVEEDVHATGKLVIGTVKGDLHDIGKNLVATMVEGSKIRRKIKVIIGGAPVTQEYADKIGADGYSPDASQAARIAKAFLNGQYCDK